MLQVETAVDQAVYLTAGWIPFRLESFASSEYLILALLWEGPGIAIEGVNRSYLSPVVM